MNDFGPIEHTNDRVRATGIIVAAFQADPFLRWVYPETADYLKSFPRIVEPFGGKAFDTGTAFSFTEPAGVALWLGPGIESDGDAMGEVITETVSEERLEDLGGVVEQMAEFHPHEPHWYLPLIGITPAYQGKGLGSALMQHALALADEAGLPAYLEATSESNRRLYERLGFKLLGEIQSGNSPPMWAMRREPHRK